MTHIEMANLIGDIEEQEFEERQGYYEEPEELIEISTEPDEEGCSTPNLRRN